MAIQPCGERAVAAADCGVEATTDPSHMPVTALGHPAAADVPAPTDL